ncbi:MAG: hypothetical protein HUJ67_02065, partial [Ruminiclostridium sp.]|nr:hypothetical protein [Ruminiclostridium sp.]
MAKTRRKILSILLSLAMVVSLFPGVSMTAAAAEEETTHMHAVSADCSITGSEVVSFQPLPADIGSIDTAGTYYYYLDEDVTLTSTMEIGNGVIVNLCLNGNVLKRNVLKGDDCGSVISVSEGGELNLCDCCGHDEPHYFYTADPSALNGAPWTLTEQTTGDNITAVTGGVITGGKGQYGHGGGVYNGGTFTMYGGSIVGNISYIDGGGVWNGSGAFTMYGGSITDNSSFNGGGVYNNGAFSMAGGSITGNFAMEGGGVFNNGTFSMTGGNITGNSCDGVRTYGTLNVSGSVVIAGNRNGPIAYNVYLNADPQNERAIKPLNVVAPLTAGASIGVTVDSSFTPTVENPVAITGANSADYSNEYFFSDKSAYVTFNGGDNVVQLKPGHKHALGTGADLVVFDKQITSAGGTLTTGNYYLTEDLYLFSNHLTITGNVNLCLGGNRLESTRSGPVITVKSGAVLNICDCNSGERIHSFRAPSNDGQTPAAGMWVL